MRQAENERLAARRKLAALLGDEQLAYDSVEGNARELTELGDFQNSFDHLAQTSPEIAALFAEVEQARRQLARAYVEPVPNVTWQTTLQYGTGSDDVVAGFQVGMPIPRVNRNQGAICQAQQQITVAERRAEKRLLDLRHRLAAAYESYLNAKLQIDAYDAEILPTAKETFQLISQGYQEGEVDFLQLLTAQRILFPDRASISAKTAASVADKVSKSKVCFCQAASNSVYLARKTGDSETIIDNRH